MIRLESNALLIT